MKDRRCVNAILGRVFFCMSLASTAMISSCASDDGAAKSSSARDPGGVHTTSQGAHGSSEGQPPATGSAAAVSEGESEDRLALPRNWQEVSTRFEYLCPGPVFAFEEPSTVEIVGHRFERRGSTWVRSEPWVGPLRIGLVGAPKDASDATRENLRRAYKKFKRAKVDLILVNGDLAEDEELKDVMRMLGEVFPILVAVHAGNIEWAGAFTNAFDAAHKEHPQIINMNWVRHLDLGGVHLVSLPGYHDHRFTRAGACRYSEADLKDVRDLIRPLRARGERVILTAHGPPRSKDAAAIDFAHEAGNVGDERITKLLLEEDVRVGLFSHILEAGGRATSDLKRGTPLRLPVRKPVERLYVNAGSSGSYPWLMHGGKNSEGMAMIVVVTDRGSTVKILKLR